MRLKLVLVLGFVGLLGGATCLPLTDNTRTRDPGTELAIALAAPDADLTVTQGELVEIRWTAGNLTGRPATITIELESREDLSVQSVVTATLEDIGTTESYMWNTQAYQGLYAINARIEAGDQSATATAAGKITVDAVPTFAFIEPSYAGYDPNDPNTVIPPALLTLGEDTLRISWHAGDDDRGTAQIGLDPDDDHTTGNEVIITEPNLPDPPADDSLDWDGTLDNGSTVSVGTYNLYAIVSDGINEDLTVSWPRQIKVIEPNDPEGTVVAEPSEDVDFTDADKVGLLFPEIVYRINSEDDVIVDVRLDTDDTHTNGNEITIDEQRSVAGDTDPDPFEWNGKDLADPPMDVPYGMYKVFISVTTGTATPQRYEAEGMILRRATDTTPLVAVILPTSATTAKAGDNVKIRWRDDDPDENATIRITIDDDNTPDEGVETGAAEIEILASRDAKDDSSAGDTFDWAVPALAADTYYLFVYIDDGGAGMVSVGPKEITIED